MHRRRQVGAGQQRGVDDARDRGAEGGHVGAEVGAGPDVDGEEGAVPVEGQARLRAMVAPAEVGLEALGAAGRPAHRRAQPGRREHDDELLRVELALVAEATADIGCHDAQPPLGPAELLGHQPPDVVRHLGGCVQRDAVVRRAGGGQQRPRLDRHAGQPVVACRERNGVWRGGEGRLDPGAVTPGPAEGDVAGGLGVQGWRAFGQCGIGVRQGRLDIPFHVHRLDGVAGQHAVGGDHHREDFADMPDDLTCDREARHLRAHGPQRAHRAHPGRFEIGAGQDEGHAGQGRHLVQVGQAEAGMGVRRTGHGAVQPRRRRNIRHEQALASQQPVILEPSQRLADAALQLSRPWPGRVPRGPVPGGHRPRGR